MQNQYFFLENEKENHLKNFITFVFNGKCKKENERQLKS